MKRYIEDEESATLTIVLAELSRKLLKEVASGHETAKGRAARLREDSDRDGEADGGDSGTCEIDVERERKVPGWGLADSIVLAKARVGDGRVVTGDKPFIDLKDETVLIQ
ncbi:MAG: hypothetical protein QW587_05935 [Candidatus Bathyarchaeia archaeon]